MIKTKRALIKQKVNFQIGSGHAAGNRYQKSKRLQKEFPSSRSRLVIQQFQNFLSAQNSEAILLRKYFDKFGELPPFNPNLPKEHDED